MDTDQIQNLINNTITIFKPTVPRGASYEPLNVDTYLAKASDKDKSDLILIHRINSIINEQGISISYTFTTYEKEITNQWGEHNDDEFIKWESAKGFTAGVGTNNEPLSYVDLLQKLKTGKVSLEQFARAIGNDQINQAIKTPVTSAELLQLRTILAYDQQRVVYGWLFLAENTKNYYSRNILYDIYRIEHFQDAGYLVDLNRLNNLRWRYYQFTYNDNMAKLKRSEENGSTDRKTILDCALEALKSALWLNADTSFARIYADEALDGLLKYVLPTTIEAAEYLNSKKSLFTIKPNVEKAQNEMTATRWQDKKDTILLWARFSGRDIKPEINEIAKRCKLVHKDIV